MIDKATCRSIARKRLARLSPVNIADNSRTICQTLAESSIDFRRLVAYSSFDREVCLEYFLNAQRASIEQLAFPRFNRRLSRYELVLVTDLNRDMERAHYGILEPKASLSPMPEDDCQGFTWLVPGLAFSVAGVRLGRGKGYYDRLMKGRSGSKIAIAHSCQIMDQVPSDSNDIGMNQVVTETAVYRAG
ncbi:MAG: 5-formyltetrahydrofolate cyclo-ligase [Halieaceae bacterium]|jgi:5-formyltetrahydrofolate cyclo-ligase|nr:5-formyltetrahydrofolate cyclo-ligase [Halieaceae bacterium]